MIQEEDSQVLSSPNNSVLYSSPVRNSRGKQLEPISENDLVRTPLYHKYVSDRENLIASARAQSLVFENEDQSTFTYLEVTNLLKRLKQDRSSFEKNLPELFSRSLSTLSILYDLLGSPMMARIKELYSDVTVDNTLKVLMRSKLQYEHIFKMVQLFASLEKYEGMKQQLFSILESACPGIDLANPSADLEVHKETLQTLARQFEQFHNLAKEVIKIANQLSKGRPAEDSNLVFNGAEVAESTISETKRVQKLLKSLTYQSGTRSGTSSPKKFLASNLQIPIDEDRNETSSKMTGSKMSNFESIRSQSKAGGQEGSPQFLKMKIKHQRATQAYKRSVSQIRKLGSKKRGKKLSPFNPAMASGSQSPRAGVGIQLNQDSGLDKYPAIDQKFQTQQMFIQEFSRPSGNKRRFFKSKKHSLQRKAQQMSNVMESPEHEHSGAVVDQFPTTTESTSEAYPLVISKATQSKYHNIKTAKSRKVSMPSVMPRNHEQIYDLHGRPLIMSEAHTTKNSDVHSRIDIPPQLPPQPQTLEDLGFIGAISAEAVKKKANSNFPPGSANFQQTLKVAPLRTEYTSGIINYTRAKPLPPNPAKAMLNKLKFSALNQNSGNLEKQPQQAKPAAKIKNLPKLHPKSPQKKNTSPKVETAAVFNFKQPTVSRPVGASEKAHIYNPRAKKHSLPPPKGVVKTMGADPLSPEEVASPSRNLLQNILNNDTTMRSLSQTQDDGPSDGDKTPTQKVYVTSDDRKGENSSEMAPKNTSGTATQRHLEHFDTMNQTAFPTTTKMKLTPLGHSRFVPHERKTSYGSITPGPINPSGLPSLAFKKQRSIDRQNIHRRDPSNDTLNKFGHVVKHNNPINNSPTSQSIQIQKSSAGALHSLYMGNRREEGFTQGFQNVWVTPNEAMFRDTSMQSASKEQEREAKVLMFRMQRQKEKEAKQLEKKLKDDMCAFYLQNYGITLSQQVIFFSTPEKLREIFIKKATDVVQFQAASRIQKWFYGRLKRKEFLLMINRTVKATFRIQKAWRYYKTFILIPNRKHREKVKKANFVKRVMRGYQARRQVLKLRSKIQVEELYEQFHKIDIIMRSNLQRRVRRAWKKYVARKEEKARLAAAEEEKKKGKRRGKKQVTNQNTVQIQNNNGRNGASTLAAPQASMQLPRKTTAFITDENNRLAMKHEDRPLGSLNLGNYQHSAAVGGDQGLSDTFSSNLTPHKNFMQTGGPELNFDMSLNRDLNNGEGSHDVTAKRLADISEGNNEGSVEEPEMLKKVSAEHDDFNETINIRTEQSYFVPQKSIGIIDVTKSEDENENPDQSRSDHLNVIEERD